MFADCVRSVVCGFMDYEEDAWKDLKEGEAEGDAENGESFQNRRGPRGRGAMMAIANLITIVIVLGLVLLVGKFLWNNYVSKYITIVKPVPSVWELLILVIALDLFMAR